MAKSIIEIYWGVLLPGTWGDTLISMRIWCTISQSKYIEFWKKTRRLVGASPLIMAVVKANGYGLGAIPLSLAAQSARVVDWFGVATIDEAIALRNAGISLPILLLSEPAPENIEIALRHDIQLVVYSSEFIQVVSTICGRIKIPANLHLKINTGMNRLGCDESMASDLVTAVQSSPHLTLRGVMSHLACANTPSHPMNVQQLTRFQSIVSNLSLSDQVIHHIANSAATQNFPASHMDMVRIGIDSYTPIVSLRTRVINVLRVRAGDTISYGGSATVSKDTTIVTLSAGYADGIPRCFSGDVLLSNNRHPSIGPICMDMMMIDVGNHHYAIGDIATLVGGDSSNILTLNEFAHASQRITYESLTGLSPRVHRNYC